MLNQCVVGVFAPLDIHIIRCGIGVGFPFCIYTFEPTLGLGDIYTTVGDITLRPGRYGFGESDCTYISQILVGPVGSLGADGHFAGRFIYIDTVQVGCVVVSDRVVGSGEIHLIGGGIHLDGMVTARRCGIDG